MLGVKRTERVLPTGTSLTVVGEVVFASQIGLCSVALLLVDMSNVLCFVFSFCLLLFYRNRPLKMMLELFEFSDHTKDHFMYHQKALINLS